MSLGRFVASFASKSTSIANNRTRRRPQICSGLLTSPVLNGSTELSTFPFSDAQFVLWENHSGLKGVGSSIVRSVQSTEAWHWNRCPSIEMFVSRRLRHSIYVRQKLSFCEENAYVRTIRRLKRRCTKSHDRFLNVLGSVRVTEQLTSSVAYTFNRKHALSRCTGDAHRGFMLCNDLRELRQVETDTPKSALNFLSNTWFDDDVEERPKKDAAA